jgi:hypothetical protein
VEQRRGTVPENRHRALSAWGRATGFKCAAPAGRPRKPALGRPWATVRSHDEGLPLMAGRGADASGRKPVRRKRAEAREEKSSVARPEDTVPGTEIAASGAPEGERADRKARAAIRQHFKEASPGAPSPHFKEGRDRG